MVLGQGEELLTQETICHIRVRAHEVDHTASSKAIAHSSNAICIRIWLLHCLHRAITNSQGSNRCERPLQYDLAAHELQARTQDWAINVSHNVIIILKTLR